MKQIILAFGIAIASTWLDAYADQTRHPSCEDEAEHVQKDSADRPPALPDGEEGHGRRMGPPPDGEDGRGHRMGPPPDGEDGRGRHMVPPPDGEEGRGRLWYGDGAQLYRGTNQESYSLPHEGYRVLCH